MQISLEELFAGSMESLIECANVDYHSKKVEKFYGYLVWNEIT